MKDFFMSGFSGITFLCFKNTFQTIFKQIYGDTVYGFLFDYKMDYARKLLDSGSYNVNEVGLKIGYSTGSHFIAAFKKKFGTTPKKYLISINTNA